jgi:hypothetical protein
LIESGEIRCEDNTYCHEFVGRICTFDADWRGSPWLLLVERVGWWSVVVELWRETCVTTAMAFRDAA